ncbi:MAG: hypothetical protein QM484_15445 [Woeseiaceae bacterium]
MGTYQTKIVGDLICSKLVGELNSELSSEWIAGLETQELDKSKTLHRLHDVREINAIHLSFDDLWAVAQRRLSTYEMCEKTLTVFWVSTPLNYGVARMYQALTDGTPFKIEVLYKIEEVAKFLNVDLETVKNIKF